MPCTPAIITLTMLTAPSGCTSLPEFQTFTQRCVAANNIIYTYPNFCNIEVGLKQPVSIFPLPESDQGAEAAIIVKIEGNSQEQRITWTIKDEANYDSGGCREPVLCPCCSCIPNPNAGNDVASGTIVNTASCPPNAVIPVETQFEQLEFWTNTFQNRSIDQSFEFKICTGVPAAAYTKIVLLRDFRATISMQSPVTWNASLDMILGDTVLTVDEVDAL